MEKIKVLLVDDEYLALNLLEDFVQQLPDLEIVARLKSPLQAVELLQRETIDLLFLDIQMPTLSGTNLLKTLQHPPVTIFTTAYTEYALDAFELNAIDYLLKPYAFERFVQAVNKAREHIQLRRQVSVTPTSSPNKMVASSDFIVVKADHRRLKIQLDDILYIEGLREYVRIVCPKEKIVILESLKQLTEQLPSDRFARVHKSYIVAIQKVQAMEGNLLHLGTHRIPVSRDKKEQITQLIFGDH